MNSAQMVESFWKIRAMKLRALFQLKHMFLLKLVYFRICIAHPVPIKKC